MFNFQADIIRRRKLKKTRIFSGLVSTAILVYFGISYLNFGSVPIVDRFISQIGLYDYLGWIYLVFCTGLVLDVAFAAFHVFRKRTTIGGQVAFDEEKLQIVKGRDKYIIPESEIQEITFELQPTLELPQAKGGNWLKIPTKQGTFTCELDINTPRKKEELMNMIEFLKIEHDVEVKVKELSK